MTLVPSLFHFNCTLSPLKNVFWEMGEVKLGTLYTLTAAGCPYSIGQRVFAIAMILTYLAFGYENRNGMVLSGRDSEICNPFDPQFVPYSR